MFLFISLSYRQLEGMMKRNMRVTSPSVGDPNPQTAGWFDPQADRMNLDLQDVAINRSSDDAAFDGGLRHLNLCGGGGDLRFGLIESRLRGFHGRTAARQFLGADGA